jgi:tetratricopeptide (TPR) repeat protein
MVSCRFQHSKLFFARFLLPRAVLLLLALIPATSFLAGARPQAFELTGRIELPDGRIETRVRPRVFLQAIKTIFYDRTEADRDWTFRFSNVEAGKYTVFAIAPGLGSLKKTLVIGESQADGRGRIEITLTLLASSADSAEVSTVTLGIPKEATREYRKALDSLGKQDREAAIRHLEKAVRLAPQFADAWNRLGTISYKAQEYPNAERYFREAMEQDPTSYAPLVNLGAALLSQGKLHDALTVNLEAVERQSDDPLAHAQLGGTYFALGELDQAERHLKTAKMKDEKHFSNPQLMLARIYVQQENYSAVIEELEEFLRLHPDYPESEKLQQVIEVTREKMKAPSQPERKLWH